MKKNDVMSGHMLQRFANGENYILNPPLPSALNIELNSTCNEKCVFCPFHGKYAPRHPENVRMSYEDAKKILDQAKELGIGNREVGFYLRGEPLLHTDFARTVKYAKELGFKYTFATTNLSINNTDIIKEIIDAGIDSLRVSINASNRKKYEEIHGIDAFDVVVSNIKYISEYVTSNNILLNISLSCVLTKDTINIQSEIRELFDEYVNEIVFIPVCTKRLIQNEELLQKYKIESENNLERKKDYYCSLLFNSMYVDADLKVVPCCNANDKDVYFYDLNDDFNLEHAWNCDEYIYYRKVFLDNKELPEICGCCENLFNGFENMIMK
ncbi:MAG: radical SAM protein [Lachnospiraceae bacterium]|nr:radical SAM protein [Lachnospiraceae bacterium]